MIIFSLQNQEIKLLKISQMIKKFSAIFTLRKLIINARVTVQENCSSCPRQYYSKEGTCNYRTKISYDSNKFCYSNNIIFKWRGYLYTRKMLTYSFIKDAFLPSEDCPDDRKLWGILDNYGHKLCLPFNEICPINKIAVNNIPNDGYKYTSIEIDNITLYYTNEAVKNGRILWNVNVDSTVKIVNDCEILDTIPLLDLMEYNRNIYFDLKDKITSEDKAFLKWCPALKDGITDLVKRREEYAIYLNNVKINKYITNLIIKVEDYDFVLIGTIFYMIGLFLFAINLIDKFSKKPCGCFMETVKGLSTFSYIYIFLLLFFLHFLLSYP